jgi:hypothetical protein
MTFTGVFGTECSPINALLDLLPAADTSRLGKTCRAMHRAVSAYHPPSRVNELTRILKKLPSGRPFSLAWAPEKCRESRTFVELAVRRDGSNYEHAGSLQKDTLICKVALISAKLFNPPETERILKLMDPEISARPDVRAILEATIPAVKKDLWLRAGLCCLVDQEFLGKDKEFLLEVRQLSGSILAYVSPELQADEEVVLPAVQQNGMALEYTPRP